MTDKFTLDSLHSLIDRYLAGEKQVRPLIVWFDCGKDMDLLDLNSIATDFLGLAQWYAQHYDPHIAYDTNQGSPLTDHDYAISADGNNTIRLTEQQRREFMLFGDVVKPDTRVYIKTSFINYIGKKGLNTFEYAQMLHSRLGIPTLLFFPKVWKQTMETEADLSGFDHVACENRIESAEEFRPLFMERAKGRVNRFILDYLAEAPIEHLSSHFDANKGIMRASLSKYLSASRTMLNPLRGLFPGLTDINLEELEPALNELPDEVWNEWCERHRAAKSDNRLDCFKLTLLSKIEGRLPAEVTDAMMHFYNLNE